MRHDETNRCLYNYVSVDGMYIIFLSSGQKVATFHHLFYKK